MRLKARAGVRSVEPQWRHAPSTSSSSRQRDLQLRQSTSGSVKVARWPDASHTRGAMRMGAWRPQGRRAWLETMDNHHKSGGSTRRDLLKRGAIAGGTLLWATPVIQSLDLRAAAAAAGTEKPPPPTIAEKMPPSVVTTTTSPEERPPFPPAGQA